MNPIEHAAGPETGLQAIGRTWGCSLRGRDSRLRVKSASPVPEFGEWTQKLNRHGQKITETVALPVKDHFHLPRALIYCIEVLERLAEGPTTN